MCVKDKDFGKGSMHHPHMNPNAEVSTTIRIYDHYSLDRAYMGETFFWGLNPMQGDTVSFKFSPPISIERYMGSCVFDGLPNSNVLGIP